MRLGSAALLACSMALACSEDPIGPGPAGQACQYIGTVTGDDNKDRPASQDDCVYIGSLNPLTGALGAVGLPLQNAARLAVRDINQAGDLDGRRKLCLVACDSRTDPSTVPGTVQALIDQYKIAALNGAAASSNSRAASVVTRQAGIPQVSCCSTSPILSSTTGMEQHGHVLRTVPSDALQGLVLASVAVESPKPAESVSVIYVNDTYGESLRDVFVRAFTAPPINGRVITTVPYSPGAPGYTDVIEKAFATIPTHAALVAFPTDGAQIMRDWRTSGLGRDVKWFATDGLKDDKFVQGAGARTADSVVGTAPVLRGEFFDDFASRYSAEYGGEAPGIFTSNQYDAVVLIALGIARRLAFPEAQRPALKDAIIDVSKGGTGASGRRPVSPRDLADALARAKQREDIDYVGASGGVNMEQNGDVLSDYRVWRVSMGAIEDTADCWRCTRKPDICTKRCD